MESFDLFKRDKFYFMTSGYTKDWKTWQLPARLNKSFSVWSVIILILKLYNIFQDWDLYEVVFREIFWKEIRLLFRIRLYLMIFNLRACNVRRFLPYGHFFGFQLPQKKNEISSLFGKSIFHFLWKLNRPKQCR